MMPGIAPRTGNPVRRATVVRISRMTGLQTASKLIGGQAALGEALGIKDRSLRSKIAATRGVSSADLLAAARALEAHAERIVAHARKLRDEAAT